MKIPPNTTKFLFYLLLALNLLPVLGVGYFFTGDGPAHLYNSNLILQLVSSETSPAAEFFHLRQALIPNLGGHILLVFFNWFLPARIAEQIVFALAMALTATGFRYLLHSFRQKSSLGQFLIFPLLHNFCFYIGFQSFCLSFGLMLFSIGFAVRARGNFGLGQSLILMLLLFVTTMFHLFAGVIAIMFLGMFFLRELLHKKNWNYKPLLAAVPSLIFCGWYLLQNAGHSTPEWPNTLEVFKDILRARPLITLSDKEATTSIAYAILLLPLLVLALVARFRNARTPTAADIAITSLLLLVFCFAVPNEISSGGFITIRLMLCFFIFLSLWIGIYLKKKPVSMILVLLLAALNLWQIFYHSRQSRERSADAAKLMEAAGYIPSGSSVLPLNYSYHWLHYNIGNYLGSEKQIIVLDNYEADKTHFPVQWNHGKDPRGRLGNFGTSNRPLLEVAPYEKETGATVDFVVLWKHQSTYDDEATLATEALLAEKFEPVHISEDGNLKVFKRRGSKSP